MSVRQALVSVIIPTFNRAHCIERCVRSVLQQSFSNLEVIVVDDGSTDNTADCLHSLIAEDSRIHYIQQPNGGVSAARNTGLRQAQGEFIALLDSDDLWKPWKLEAQVDALRRLPQVGMVSSDMTAVDPTGRVVAERYLKRMYGAYRKLGSDRLYPHVIEIPVPTGCDLSGESLPILYGEIYSKMLRGNLIHTPTVLLRRERWEQVGFFDESLRCGEDFVFHLRTCRMGPVACLDVSTLLYQIGCDDQITHHRNHVPFARAFLNTIQTEFRDFPDQVSLTPGERNRIFADAHEWLATDLLEIGRRGESLKHAALTIRYAPISRESWITAVRSILPHSVRLMLRRLRRWISSLQARNRDQDAASDNIPASTSAAAY